MAVSLNKTQESIIACMKIVYLQAKENLATRKFPVLKQLCIDLGCLSLRNFNIDGREPRYESYESIREMEEAMSCVIEENIKKKLQKCHWFSLMIDECTDVSVEQSMIIYAKILYKGKVCCHYLRLTKLKGCTSADLYECIEKTLIKMEIDFSKCSSIATDGASVMVGVRGGVTALIKKKYPYVTSVHCVAHRLALAASQAAQECAYLVKYQDILNRIHSYFQHSPKNTSRLRELQEVFQEQPLKFVLSSNTRWLSFGNSVQACYKNWSSLVSLLMEDPRPVAQGLLKQVTTYAFIATTAMLMDTMYCINKLCLSFQMSNIDFHTVQACVYSTLNNLRTIKNGGGINFLSFRECSPQQVTENFEYKNHTVKDGSKYRQIFDSTMKMFLEILIKNISERLGDLEIVKIFNIFVPSNMPEDKSKLSTFGDSEILKMYELLACHESYKTKKDQLQSEWSIFREFMFNRCRNMNFESFLSFIHVNDFICEQYPLIYSLIEYAAVIPLQTVDCERGFSRMNLVKTELRNRLLIENVNNLLMISIEGPERADFDFEEAFRKWALKKQRKVLTV